MLSIIKAKFNATEEKNTENSLIIRIRHLQRFVLINGISISSFNMQHANFDKNEVFQSIIINVIVFILKY